jgi:predicted amidohydrolase
MIVAGVQHDIDWEQPARTCERVAPLVARAAAAGARLVALSEMYATGFSMRSDRIAEPDDGPSTRFLREQALAHRVWVCGSVPTHRDGGLPVNRFVLAAPDGRVRRYDKRHPFSYAGEHEHYDAGDEIITVDVEGVRVTPFVCYDLRYADDFWATAEQTDLYVVVANWPASRRVHWTTLLRARAIENQAYVLGVNRIGTGDGLDYAGDTCLFDPFGEIVAEADGPHEQLVCGVVDPARVREVRERYPFLRDRRG